MSVHVETIVEQQEEIARLEKEVTRLQKELKEERTAADRLVVASNRVLPLLVEMHRTFTARQIRQAINTITALHTRE